IGSARPACGPREANFAPLLAQLKRNLAPDLSEGDEHREHPRSGRLPAGAWCRVRPCRAACRGRGPSRRQREGGQGCPRQRLCLLKTKQASDGSFSSKFFGPGPTALVVAGLARNGYKNDDPVVKKALAYLSSKVQKNGGIYEKRLANYT